MNQMDFENEKYICVLLFNAKENYFYKNYNARSATHTTKSGVNKRERQLNAKLGQKKLTMAKGQERHKIEMVC